MKRTGMRGGTAVGACSLLVIFAALCLTVFSVLSLSTAQAEKRMSDLAAQRTAAYYEAELKAEQIFGLLREGTQVQGVQEQEGVYTYSCDISDGQRLVVSVENTRDGWNVLRWQAVAQSKAIDETLTVWDGT